MTHGGALRFLLLLGRIIERVAQKNVSVAVVATVGRDDRIESFGKSNFLHNKRAAQEERAL